MDTSYLDGYKGQNGYFIFYYFSMPKAKKLIEDASGLQWYQRHATDTGSPEYQIHNLSTRISSLQGHLQTNHKDYDAKRTLLRMVAERRSFLRYLKSNEMEKYLMVNKATWLKV